jgi:hypothetical protein
LPSSIIPFPFTEALTVPTLATVDDAVLVTIDGISCDDAVAHDGNDDDADADGGAGVDDKGDNDDDRGDTDDITLVCCMPQR